MKENNEKYSNTISSIVLGIRRRFNGAQPLKKREVTTSAICTLFFLFFCALVSSQWTKVSIVSRRHPLRKSVLSWRKTPNTRVDHQHYRFSLNCTAWNKKQQCPKNYDQTTTQKKLIMTNSSSITKTTCPDYFRWIHEDLRYWKKTGITRDMIEEASRYAHFKVVIVDGKAYMEKYWKSYQTRDLFTLWGIVQLLRLYPGRLPDMELLVNCDDYPSIKTKDYQGPNSVTILPPLFGYCSDKWSLDIVFPDWSFWGWPETNIKPWKHVLKEVIESNKRTKWEDRVPKAYWRGSPDLAGIRKDLMTCNVSDKQDWNVLLYNQKWGEEYIQGYKQSNVANQCNHRYKIYIEGRTWSVSEKYILACNSPTLYITPHYYDFYTRGMKPQEHYWPVRDGDKCKSLKFAVEWGNNHTAKAKAIGEAGSRYIQEDVKMEYVYDYMFHLMNEYAKLFKYKPSVNSKAVELCAEEIVCPEYMFFWRELMDDTLEESPSDTNPCTMPPPYDLKELKAFIHKKVELTKQVEMWENEYWKQ